MIDLADAVVIVHPLLAPVPDSAMAEALSPAAWTASTRILRFAEANLQLSDLPDADWPSLVGDLERYEPELRGLLAASGGPIIYIGMAPIPIALELGRRLGSTRRVLAFQQRHDTKSWRWPTDDLTVKVNVSGAPVAPVLAQGDAVVRVSCSHPVLEEDVRAVVRHPIAEITIDVEGAHEDVLQSDADVTTVAGLFGKALDAVATYVRHCETIHLFAAVPPALAIRMGAEINPTIHGTPIVTYQYGADRTPRYGRAVVLAERVRPPLTAEQMQAAEVAREALRGSLSALAPLAALTLDPNAWPSQLIGDAARHLPPCLPRLGPLGRNQAVVGASVSDEREANGEFRWEPATRRWVLDDRLLATLGQRLAPGDLEAAGRLFFLHEAVHLAKQGITSANAEGVGRLPRVLEEVDYLADVWALVNEYGRALHVREIDAAAAPAYFRALVHTMTATFWAFDGGAAPLRWIPVRRLNRYLIWYWIRLGLERVDHLDDVMRLLGTKPILEIAGPRARVLDGRVVFDLDDAAFDDVELGVLDDGCRMVRVGTRAGAEVRALLAALQAGDERGFLGVLRGVFDSVARP